MTDPFVNTREILATLSDDKLLALAEAIDQERRNRRRTMWATQFGLQERRRKLERRAV